MSIQRVIRELKFETGSEYGVSMNHWQNTTNKLVLVGVILGINCSGCYPRRLGIVEQRLAEVTQALEAKQKKELSLEAQLEQLRNEYAGVQGQLETLTKQVAILVAASGGDSVPALTRSGVATLKPALPLPVEVNAQQLLDRARQQSLQGNYNRAIVDLEELVTLYGTGPFGEEARFLIAQCYYAQGDYYRAFEGYSTFITTYPDSTHLAEAIYKAALASEVLGVKDRATLLYKELIARYRNSKEARLAADKLAALEKQP